MKIFGRNVPVIALVLAGLLIGTAGAAVLDVFGTHKTTATVGEALTLVDIESHITLYGGECTTAEMTAISHTSVDVLSELDTIFTGLDGEGIEVVYSVAGNILPDVDGDKKQTVIIPAGETVVVTMSVCAAINIDGGEYIITTEFEPAEDVELLKLVNKDVDWNELDDYSAYLIYTPSGNEFSYYLIGNVNQYSTDMSLIYYIDQDDRFNNWGMNELIATGTSDATGFIVMSGSVDVADFPIVDDINYPDAKIWLVTSSDLTLWESGSGWNPDNYLFETVLIPGYVKAV